MRIATILIAGGMAILSSALLAQTGHPESTKPELDLAITYNEQYSNPTQGSNFWLPGGGAELTGTFYHGLGFTANISGSHTGSVNTSGYGLSLVTATFGPTYTWKTRLHAKSPRQFRFFAESLVGIANGFDSYFPNLPNALSSDDSLALQLGGGTDLTLSRRFSMRLLHADWLRTQLPNAAANVQNNLQLGTGIVFRFR